MIEGFSPSRSSKETPPDVTKSPSKPLILSETGKEVTVSKLSSTKLPSQTTHQDVVAAGTSRLFAARAISAPLISQDPIAARKQAVENGLIPRDPQRPRGPENIHERMKALGVPGISMSIINNGRVEWSQGYGELSNQSTLTQAASISKTIAALTMLSLIEQNPQLTLDTDVSQYFGKELWSKIDPKGLTEAKENKVTIRRLLSHTAGTTVSGFDGYPSGQKKLPTTDDIILGKGNSPPVQVEAQPGIQYQYSGGGTTILQKVIEVVSKKPFAEAAREQVFAKLEMEKSTYFPKEEETVQGNGPDCKPIAGSYRLHPEHAAAGLWSTPQELALVAICIQRSLSGEKGSLLSQKMAREMLTAQTEGKPNGLGVFAGQLPHALMFDHSGSNEGFRCIFVANDHGQGAVIMTNSDNGAALKDEILEAIVKEYNWPDADLLPQLEPLYDPKEAGPVDPEVWYKKYAGSYCYKDKVGDHIVKVSKSEGKIMTQVDTDPPFEVVPFGEKIGYYQPHKPGPFNIVRFSEDKQGRPILILFGIKHPRMG